MTAKAEIPPANGNQIKVWPGRVQSVTDLFNFDPGSWRAFAFIYYLRYNNTIHSNNALFKWIICVMCIYDTSSRLIDDGLGRSFSSGSSHQLLEDGRQFHLTFDNPILTTLEVDPAFVESVQHLDAW
jgi:hypothetical protein